MHGSGDSRGKHSIAADYTGAGAIPYNPPVAEDQGKEEEKFDFTSEGEGLLTLGDARMLAVRTAAESPGDYGKNFREVAMVFEVVESGEDADYYNITLSVRPQGNFAGSPGQEQFVIGQEGTVVLRQVLSSPVREGGGFPVIPVAIGLVVVGAIAAAGAVFVLMGSGGDSVPIAVVAPTETPAPIEPTVNIEKPAVAPVQQGLAVRATSAPPMPTVTPTSRKPASSSRGTTGESFEFQYVCVNRTLLPCQVIQEFMDSVRARTDGQVDIQLTSYPELGISGFDMIRLLEDGTIGMGEIYSGFASGEFPVFEAANLWGAYASVDEWFEASEALQEDIKSLVNRETGGGRIVGFNYYGGNYFFSKKPLNTLADFQGVKTRAYSVVLGDFISSLGAYPQTMAFADVYPALQRGVLDAGVTCGSCAIGQKWYEVTDYITGPIPGSWIQTFVTFNSKQWNSLPADFQAILLEEGALHSKRAKAAALQADIEAEGQLELRMEHTNFSPEMLGIFKDAAASSVIPNWVLRAGGPESEAVKLYNTKVAPITGLYVASDGSVDEK